jgi:hypothetical protein
MRTLIQILNVIGEVYWYACAAVVTLVLFLMAIFGGEIHISINFHSLIDLINKLRGS